MQTWLWLRSWLSELSDTNTFARTPHQDLRGLAGLHGTTLPAGKGRAGTCVQDPTDARRDFLLPVKLCPCPQLPGDKHHAEGTVDQPQDRCLQLGLVAAALPPVRLPRLEGHAPCRQGGPRGGGGEGIGLRWVDSVQGSRAVRCVGLSWLGRRTTDRDGAASGAARRQPWSDGSALSARSRATAGTPASAACAGCAGTPSAP